MRGFNALVTAMILTVTAAAYAKAPVKSKAKAAAAVQAQLQAEIRKLTDERDELKDRLAATGNLQEDLAAAQKSRDLARQETETVRKELEQIKNALSENQGSADTILADLQKAKADLAAATAANEALRKEVAAGKVKQAAPTGEGTLVVLTPDILPARPMTLQRITPKAKRVARGVVVVNVLVNEAGEVLDTRLLQGLPGQGEWVEKANAACVEQARRLVFDPARSADGKTKVRVWQGVGFLID